MAKVAAWSGVMTFGSNGNFKTWAATGWSAPEANFTWMEGFQATLQFATAPPSADQLLIASVMPVKSKARQHMNVYFNGRFLGLYVANPEGAPEWTIPIKKGYFEAADASNVLTFACPNAIVPSEEGIGADKRRLSFAFMRLALRDAPN